MSYTYANNIKTMLIAQLSQFVTDANGSNLGVGFTGWDESLAYARKYDKAYFGSVFLASGDGVPPDAFTHKFWKWVYLIRLHVRYDGKDVQAVDQNVMGLAEDVLEVMTVTNNRRSIISTGAANVVAANYLSEPFKINDVTWLSMEFLITVNAQL